VLVTGKRLLDVANREGFAVPAYNIASWSMFNAIYDQCEDDAAPWICAISPDELTHSRPDALRAYASAAHRATAPIALHLDRATSFGQVMAAIRHGFTSVMLDASAQPFDINAALVAKSVEAAHAAGIGIEAALAGNGLEAAAPEGEEAPSRTDPASAAAFVAETRCDSLAIDIGANGETPPRDGTPGPAPRLRLDLLAEIKSACPAPLSIRGDAGNPESEVGEAVRLGVNKIDISDDVKGAYFSMLRRVLADPNLREPRRIERPAEAAAARLAHRKNLLADAVDRASLY
jgi:fructose-bisphosphate aldolase class II